MNTAHSSNDMESSRRKFARRPLRAVSLDHRRDTGGHCPDGDELMQLKRLQNAIGQEPALDCTTLHSFTNEVLHVNAQDAHELREVCRCTNVNGLMLRIRATGIYPMRVPDASRRTGSSRTWTWHLPDEERRWTRSCLSVAALKFACGVPAGIVGDGKLRNGEVKSSVCHERMAEWRKRKLA